ncbi:hypothetical protein [Ponticaulis profundi]|uniref:DUF1311 domain-containing protein n=1 Tax=Ponticaulis profundi TaxID=2665222 RepID=A0ABW1SB66_9PROT
MALSLGAMACTTGAQSARDQAFTACRDKIGTDELSKCTRAEIAAARSSQLAMNAQYQAELDACEARRNEAAAFGAGADQISCSSNPADYLLGGADN